MTEAATIEVTTSRPASPCPRCRAANVYHVARDLWHCGGCDRDLRLVTGSNGPTLVPHLRLPWEVPASTRKYRR